MKVETLINNYESITDALGEKNGLNFEGIIKIVCNKMRDIKMKSINNISL